MHRLLDALRLTLRHDIRAFRLCVENAPGGAEPEDRRRRRVVSAEKVTKRKVAYRVTVSRVRTGCSRDWSGEKQLRLLVWSVMNLIDCGGVSDSESYLYRRGCQGLKPSLPQQLITEYGVVWPESGEPFNILATRTVNGEGGCT
jgi:hypothetical protein